MAVSFRALRPTGRLPTSRGSRHVVGFIKTAESQTRVPVRAPAPGLEEKALEWIASISDRTLCCDLLSENATYHDDGMWLLQPARGRTAIRKVWRDWLRSVPDYQIDVIDCASQPETNNAFVCWRASGMPVRTGARPCTGKPFQHYGVTRLHFDSEGRITDQWTWRGPTTDEAHWLLTRSCKPFDFAAFRPAATAGRRGSPAGSPSASLASLDAHDSHLLLGNALAGLTRQPAAGAADLAAADAAARSRCKAAALTFREVFGAVPGADPSRLGAALADDYACVEATGVWRAVNLPGRDECIDYCSQRQQQLSGAPHWHSEAVTADGRMLFVHFQNVLTSKQHGTLVGLSSGILVHMFDERREKIARTMMFRGPMSMAERSEFFNMDCRPGGSGRVQAESRGASDKKILPGL